MRIELTAGVHLNVIPTTKFKTTRIAVHFLAPADADQYAARTLLTSVLETASAAYPTQAALSAELETLFGANFGIGVGKEGGMHRVSATLDLVADGLAQAPLLAAGFDFLREVLTRPLTVAGRFDAAVFTRERANLIDYLNSLDEDRQTQASLALQALYFDAPSQKAPSFGTVAGLEAVTEAGLWATYQAMLSQDQVEIVVLGDVNPAAVTALASGLGLAPRNPAEAPYAIDQTPSALRRGTDAVSVNQAKLDLGYHTPVALYGADYYATVVAVELFGGSPLSLLFTNVREKASKAYYASAVLDPFRHFVQVQTGIDPADATEVEGLIAAQLARVVAGEFSDDLLQRIKDGLTNGRLIAYDAPRFLARQALLHALIPTHQEGYDAFASGVAAVTREDVQRVAAGLDLHAVYLLTSKEGN
ncbi:EF-P 5-aminopentanol modification-associated protein YfmF [Lacticaseibacillus kribbianus]|uniref:EF-P 5-aminopentanol modification-associated protein YfmF n=1 Tax=Lacticaseibacillus kribbianus TaxID=2926292 RepID=UPI001CD51270|nr:pitrilysin family protein [Lacticaseibacillus kribbianus]